MTAHLKSLLFSVVLVGLSPSIALAQIAGTGAVAGTISDPTGATVAEANVAVTSSATGQTLNTVSQSNGRYTMALLPPGTYKIAVTKPGFKATIENEIHIDVGGTTRLDIVMALGELSQKVTVEAAPTIADTESSTLGRVVNQQAVESLPLVTRNYTQIIGLSPGIEAPVTNATELGRGSGGVSPTQTTAGLFGRPMKGHGWQPPAISISSGRWPTKSRRTLRMKPPQERGAIIDLKVRAGDSILAKWLVFTPQPRRRL